ncbi:MAG: FixH family protein [Cyanobacteria bacterium]|nr:FixH family protein [Cyanobacteriota bacterium]
MKKALLSLVATSIFVTGCGTSGSDPVASSDTAPEATADATPDAMEGMKGMDATSGNVEFTLLSPAGSAPMGDAELTLAVTDSATGEPITTDNLAVDITMPMDGMDPMLTEVEVSPGSEPGQYTVATYFSMEGMWAINAVVEDGGQQGKAQFMIEAQ